MERFFTALMACIASTPLSLAVVPISPLVSPAQLLWVHSPSISVAISQISGMPVHVNASAQDGAYTSDLSAMSWLGEAKASTLDVFVKMCGSGGESVCVNRTLQVLGQLPDGSCCANYTVIATDVFSAVPAPEQGAPSSISWTFRVADSLPTVPWRTRIVTDVTFLGSMHNSSDTSFWVARGGDGTAGMCACFQGR